MILDILIVCAVPYILIMIWFFLGMKRLEIINNRLEMAGRTVYTDDVTRWYVVCRATHRLKTRMFYLIYRWRS